MEAKDYQDELFYGWIEANDEDDDKVKPVTYSCCGKEWVGVVADVRLMASAFAELYDYIQFCLCDSKLENLVDDISNQMALAEVIAEDGQVVLRF